MNFKSLFSSSKIYIVLVISAIVVLIFIGSLSYLKLSALRKASDAISHTLEVEKEINVLFSTYSQLELAQLKTLLRKDTLINSGNFQKYLKNADASYQRLKILVSDNPSQLDHLKRIDTLRNGLIDALGLITNPQKSNIRLSENLINKLDDVAYIMAELEQHKQFMLAKEDALLSDRKSDYQSQVFLTPMMNLMLGIFALFVFIVSFVRINKERKIRANSEAFLASVLANTENIINYYEPVFDENNKVKNFRVKYANERNKIDLKLDPENMKGKLINEVLPFVTLHGELDKLLTAFTEKKSFNLNRQVKLNNEVIWLESNIRPLSGGLLIVSKNTSFEKESVARLNDLNDKLREQYEELKDTEEFLKNVIKSTSNVVSYFEPIRDAENKIVDFDILYTNEQIKETTGHIPKDIKNKKISEVYPFLMTSGAFDFFVDSVENDKTISYERDYVFNEQLFWFYSTIIKTGTGICVTSQNITTRKENEQKLIEANEELKIQNTILSDAEYVAQIGSYRWSNKSGESAISDNFCKLLSCDPNSFTINHENYKKLIHTNDLEKYELELQQAQEENKPFSLSYRVITKTNKIKYFRTWGHFQNHQLIGVVQDVSHVIKAELTLKEKNEELKRSNAELESFNRVASHDLQEPIRKIQMFISRIAEEDLDNMSDASKSYFEKINSSSERMRMLIRYLLSYSRINRTKNDFEEVNLHHILDKVQEDLEDRINASDVSLVIDDLPTVKAIPFQMEQLFNNLISNAIKYRGLENPRIIIDCKKLKKNEITDDFIKKSKNYYRISVLDNGIGFDREHAEKIFELFQRLHQKNEYSGTGIGLAICKKIVQNHNGHIIADSTLGIGTAFCFYLPAR
jgi:signal transduction histidine kinase/CHASE3 domain sensor protein